MAAVTGWTGETACALQTAMRLSNQAFAAHLGIGLRTVSGWHEKPTLRPQSALQQLLDTKLDQAPADVKARFAALTGDPADDVRKATDAEDRLSADANISAALNWLDHAANWEPGTARREVAARLAQVDVRHLRDRGTQRGRVDQRRVAEALTAYYPSLRTTGRPQRTRRPVAAPRPPRRLARLARGHGQHLPTAVPAVRPPVRPPLPCTTPGLGRRPSTAVPTDGRHGPALHPSPPVPHPNGGQRGQLQRPSHPMDPSRPASPIPTRLHHRHPRSG